MIRTNQDEVKMSHWIYSPTISDESGWGKIISLKDTGIDLRKFTFNGDQIEMVLFKYPDGNKPIVVTVDLVLKTGSIDGGSVIPLAEVISHLTKN